MKKKKRSTFLESNYKLYFCLLGGTTVAAIATGFTALLVTVGVLVLIPILCS